MDQPIGLFDLPTEILDDIFNPLHIGKSTQCMLLIVCKQLAARVDLYVRIGAVPQYAARDGHLDILIYAVENGYYPNSSAYIAAASAGHLHIIKYLLQIECPWDADSANAATTAGHLDIFEFIHKNNLEYKRAAIINAAARGHLDIIQYVHENNIPVSDSYHYPNYCSGHRDMSALCGPLASNGHILVLDWMFVQRQILRLTTMSPYVASGAFEGRRIDVLEWLLKNGIMPDSTWFAGATARQQIATLDWLYARGCPGSHQVRVMAQWNGLRNVIAWCDSKGL